MTPGAVAGRCRWVTAPPTSTRVPSGICSRRDGGDHPQRVEVVAQELGRIAVRRDAGGPHVGGGQFDLAHPGQGGSAKRTLRRPAAGPARCVAAAPGRPQRLSPGDPETPQRTGGRQRLGLRRGKFHAAGQVEQ